MSADGFVRWTADSKHIPKKKKKSFFPVKLESSNARSHSLVSVLPAGGCSLKLDLRDPGLWKCPRGLADFSLSSQSLCTVCLHLSASQSENLAPLCGCTWLRGLDSEGLHLGLLKILTKKLRAAAASSLCPGRDRETDLQSSKRVSKIREYLTRTQTGVKAVLTLGFSLVDLMCSGPVMSLTDVACSPLTVQTSMAVVQVFSVSLSNCGL